MLPVLQEGGQRSWGEGSEAATARKVAEKSLMQQGFRAIALDHVHSFSPRQNSIGTTD